MPFFVKQKHKKIINNHEGNIHECALQMNVRYMSLADIFIYLPYEYEVIIFNWQIVTKGYTVYKQVFTLFLQ